MVLADAPLPASAELKTLGLSMAWTGRGAVDPGRDRAVFLTADESNVYLQSDSGVLSAFDAESGRPLWSALLGLPDQVSYAVNSNQSELVLAVGMHLYSVNKFTGKTLWVLQLSEHPSTTPEIDEDNVYIGTTDGSVFAYDLRKIRKLHLDNRLPAYSHVALLWRYKAASEIKSPPLVTGRTLNFATSRGTLASVGAGDRKLNFEFETDAAISTPVAVGQGTLFVSAEDSRMYALNQTNGQVKWKFISEHPIQEQPRIIGDVLYVSPRLSGLYCLCVTTGKQVWHQREANRFLGATQTAVYSIDNLGRLARLDRSTGKSMGRMSMRGYTTNVSNDRTDRLYLATPEGTIVCLKELNTTQPTFHRYPERRPILPELAPDEPVAAEGADPQEMPEGTDSTETKPTKVTTPSTNPCISKIVE